MTRRMFAAGEGKTPFLLVALLALAAVAVAAIVTTEFTAPAQAQSEGMMLDNPGDEQISGQIVARKLSNGRLEFGWQPADSDERILPRVRYFPASPRVDEWLSSSPVTIAGTEIGSIKARRLGDGRTEFAIAPTDQVEYVYPDARYVPADARVGRWLRSSEITFTPGPEDEGMMVPEEYDGGDELGDGDDGDELGPEEYADAQLPEPEIGDEEYADALEGDDGLESDDGDELEGDGGGDGIETPPTEPRVGTRTPTTGSYTAVSAGSNHTCGLRENGAITCWGRNSIDSINFATGEHTTPKTGQTDAPAGSFRAVSAGVTHTCAIHTNGEIECWGRNSNGQTDAPAGDFHAVSAGYLHTCGLRSTGAIECWGNNDRGETSAPAGRFTAISTGSDHNCAIRSTGAIECWGDNYNGEADALPGNFRAVSTSENHTCGLRSNGEVACWGRNDTGQANPLPGRFTAVSAGTFHACGLRTSGAIECWGSNYNGEINAPAGSFRAISSGSQHTCAIRKSNGAIECWGSNWAGQTDVPGADGSDELAAEEDDPGDPAEHLDFGESVPTQR